MFKKPYIIWLIVIVAIVVSVLANLRLITQVYELTQSIKLLPAKNEELQFILKIGVKNVVVELVMLLLIISFNFFGRDSFIYRQFKKRKSIFFMITGNLLLLFLLIYIDINVEIYLSEKAGISNYYIRNYLTNRLPVLSIAFIFPYVLLQMKKAERTEQNLVRLKEEKTQAEIAALKEQISPHFFFNTLSSLSTIVRNESKETGLEFIQDMSDIYRYTLTSAQENLVTLSEELDFIQAYVSLLQKRFGKKLQFSMNIPTALHTTQLPPMSLQLLIENAIQHNIITQAKPLTIRVYIEDDQICVQNNLQEKNLSDSFGIGLNNLSNRYKLLTNQEIVIEYSRSEFMVKIPLL